METNAPARRAYGVNEAADALGVSPELIRSEIAAKKIPSFKLGNRRLIPASAIDALTSAGDSK